MVHSGKIYNELHRNQMDKKNCLQKEAGAKKLFAATTTPKKIVCVDEMSIPPLQKNNGPSLNQYFIAYKYPYKYQYYLLIFISMRYGNI
jgi:hypothetical protein